ncbi:sensor histidine kinase [Aromatoleum petrolei]|uniref:histidine kinase n=1 Tax=Aromatoleum petrolei TaxID=76116 RepID=A0ABX1MM35_9RHOO|nr:ATP-binding protein [Aromatoleum petrolei]NMF88210.1 two-component sensor histidine kinase [Aromatoleum petrolei]QTQ38931.1 Putative response regulator receiver modulated diguanylate cyclase/phosphodiesterase [Aromatoleum petrolei]
MTEMTGFDRDFSLGELLSTRDADDLCHTLSGLLGTPVAILDVGGGSFGGMVPPPGGERAPLVLELEPVGFLAADCTASALGSAARIVRWGLLSRARLRMVSDLHLEAVRADYAKLQQQNEALKASEAKYRDLAASLDAKVKEQIKVIDERQLQLYQAERLASIGQLAAGVAHEINNPLGFIGSNLSAAERYLHSLEDLRAVVPSPVWEVRDLDFVFEDFSELLKDSRAGIDRIARIVRDLKGFSSVDQPQEQVVDLNAQLETLMSVLVGQKAESVTLSTDFSPLPPLLCLPGHLNQAFLNILQNALQAVTEGGIVTVHTRTEGGAIAVEVSDSGRGIPPEIRARIFDPFFTTRGVGSGTGLGLTVARDIILAHSGTVTVICPPQGGTRVTVNLPV